jgi:hypothetical protein
LNTEPEELLLPANVSWSFIPRLARPDGRAWARAADAPANSVASRKHAHAIVRPPANGLVNFIGSIIPIKSDGDYGTGIICAEWIIAELGVF